MLRDYNFHIDWEKQKSRNSMKDELMVSIRTRFLEQYVQEPMRELQFQIQYCVLWECLIDDLLFMGV